MVEQIKSRGVTETYLGLVFGFDIYEMDAIIRLFKTTISILVIFELGGGDGVLIVEITDVCIGGFMRNDWSQAWILGFREYNMGMGDVDNVKK